LTVQNLFDRVLHQSEIDKYAVILDSISGKNPKQPDNKQYCCIYIREVAPMAKRGRKPKNQKDEYYDDIDDFGGRENITEMEEELLYQMDNSEIERYIRPTRRQEDDFGDEDSFAFWFGQN